MTNENPLVTLNGAGQSIWLDFIQRSILDNGELKTLIGTDKITGLTSNPAIFKQAIADSNEYDSAIQAAHKQNPNTSDMDLYNTLAIQDIQAAADLFKPVYEQTQGNDGMVSIEVSPKLADDAQGTIEEALLLHKRVNRKNVMIKVPGTKAGVIAFEHLTEEGINVNVTLLFSISRYKEIAKAYLNGLEKRVNAGKSIEGSNSVASFFISRVDSAVDKQLEELSNSALAGKIAIANAKIAYGHFENLFQSEQFKKFQALGAHPQRLLWASTGTKNANYSDVVYIEELIAKNTVNTVPPATLNAFRDHGKVALTLKNGLEQAHTDINSLKTLGVNLDAITDKLEQDGLSSFCDAFDELLISVKQKREILS
jgi:transaldolase